MSDVKLTVRFDGGAVIGNIPWIDADGRKVNVIDCFLGDPVKSLKQKLKDAEARIKELEDRYER